MIRMIIYYVQAAAKSVLRRKKAPQKQVKH